VEFPKELERHSACAELCLDYALGHCSEEHNQYSSYVDKFHKIRKEVKEAVEGVVDLPKKASFSKSWDQIDSNHKEYLAHIVCTKKTEVLLSLCSHKPLSW